MLKKKYIKTKQEVEVAFELAQDQAAKVELVCDANAWEPIEMKRSKEGKFRAKMRFPAERRIQFRYLVDGTTWANDEQADAYCRNQFGGENSVLDTKMTG